MNLIKGSLLLAGMMCLGGLSSIWAQSAAAKNASSATVRPAPMLDNDDMTHLVKVRQQVLATHSELKAEEEKLKAMHAATQGANPPPTAEQRNADFAEWKDYQKKMRAEMLKIDPTLKPIFAKLDDARKHGAPSPFAPASAK